MSRAPYRLYINSEGQALAREVVGDKTMATSLRRGRYLVQAYMDCAPHAILEREVLANSKRDACIRVGNPFGELTTRGWRTPQR